MRTLDSLIAQDCDGCEIIVVDNAADPRLEARVRALRSPVHRLRYVAEPRPGAHHARHAGARAATGELLLFTDDDVTAPPGWVHSYVGVFAARPDVVAAGGPSEAVFAGAAPAWLAAYVRQKAAVPALSIRSAELSLPHTPDFWSLNMAIRRAALFEAGGFNPDLVGGELVGDGETGLARKLTARGAVVAWVPAAGVYHRIAPHRMSIGYLRSRALNQGRADAWSAFAGTRPGASDIVAHALRTARSGFRYWTAALPLWPWRRRLAIDVQLRALSSSAEFVRTLRMLADSSARDAVACTDWIGADPASYSAPATSRAETAQSDDVFPLR
jgi:glucosyl-dolichyl phosphate glucuronosyltransferase